MNQNELMHYGVLGMKWGVRRYQNKMNKQANRAKGRDSLLLERTIPAGTKMYRTSTKKMEDNNGPRYISYLDVDRNHYKDGWVRQTQNAKNVYEHTYTLNTDLKIPSRETQQKVINSVIKSNKKYINESVKAYVDITVPKGYYRSSYEEFYQDYGLKKYTKSVIDSMSNKSPDEAAFKVSQSLGLAPNVKNEIISSLQKMGYNAMADEASIGGRYGWVKEGYDPLIIFDSTNLTQTKSKKISNREEYAAYQKDKKWKEKVNKNTSAKWSDTDMIGKRIMNNDELMHYGVLGMKWGVRRYQNKDGTLTKAGKKKAAKMKAQYTELTGKQLRKSPTKKTVSTTEDSKKEPKKLSEMSDTELREKANRLRLEKEYISAERERAALTPKDVNKGKAFVETLTDKVIKPALIDAGKAVVKNYTQAKLQDLLGVEVSKTGPRIIKPGNKPDKDDDKD